MTTTLPSHLESTADQLKAAFPNGIPENHYRPLLRHLAEELSLRNVAVVIAHITGKPYERVENDVFGAQQLSLESTLEIADLLRVQGYPQADTEA